MKNQLITAIAVLAVFVSCSKKNDETPNPNDVPCTLVAAFTYTVDAVNEQIVFTGQSTGEIATYEWQFGDNGSSTSKDPSHQYTSGGVKHVCLTVRNADGTCSNQKCIDVTVPASAVAVEVKNKAILLDFSETWCPPCGAYGGPAFDSSLSLETTKLTAMKIYGSSSPSTLNSQFASTIKTDYNITGVPTFYVNSTPMFASGGVYSSLSANYNWILNQANPFSAQTVKAGFAITKSITGSNITVDAKVKFLTAQAAGKDYRLAIYIVEDNIIAAQEVSGQGTVTTYKHRNLMRKTASTTYKGEQLNTGNVAISANKIYNKTYTIAMGSTWNQANLKVIGVVWDATLSGKPALVNSFVLK